MWGVNSKKIDKKLKKRKKETIRGESKRGNGLLLSPSPLPALTETKIRIKAEGEKTEANGF